MPNLSDQPNIYRDRTNLYAYAKYASARIANNSTAIQQVLNVFLSLFPGDNNVYKCVVQHNSIVYDSIITYNATIAKYNTFRKTYSIATDRPGLILPDNSYQYIRYKGLTCMLPTGPSISLTNAVPPAIYTFNF